MNPSLVTERTAPLDRNGLVLHPVGLSELGISQR